MLLAACMLLQQTGAQHGGFPSDINSLMLAQEMMGGAANASRVPSPPASLTATTGSSETSTASEEPTNESDKLSDEEFFSDKAPEGGHHEDRDTKNETFPIKLYRMLFEAEEEGKQDVVSFAPSGRAFYIHKPEQFMADIMPRYFTTTRMASFQRQLNLYGFRRLTHGPDKGGYCQQHFIKGKRYMCNKIKRKSQSLVHKPVNSNSFAAGAAAMGGLSMYEMNGALGGASTLSSLAAADYNARLGLLARAGMTQTRPPLSSLMGLVRSGLLDRSGMGSSGLSALQQQPQINATATVSETNSDKASATSNEDAVSKATS